MATLLALKKTTYDTTTDDEEKANILGEIGEHCNSSPGVIDFLDDCVDDVASGRISDTRQLNALVPFYFGEFRYGSLKRPWEVRLCIESTA